MPEGPSDPDPRDIKIDDGQRNATSMQWEHVPKHRIGSYRRSYVLASDLTEQQVEKVVSDYGDTPGSQVRAYVGKKGGLSAVTPRSKQRGDLYLEATLVRLSSFLQPPSPRIHTFQDEVYVPEQHLRVAGCEYDDPSGAVFGSVEDDGVITPRSRSIGNGYTFYPVASVVRAHPELRGDLLRLASRSNDIPDFPTYSLRGDPRRRFLTTYDFRRLATCGGQRIPDGDDRDVFGFNLRAADKLVPSRYVLVGRVDGEMVTKVDLKNTLSSVFIDVEWVSNERSGLSGVADLVRPAKPGVIPITGAHPPNRGSTGHNNGPSPTASYKATIAARLKDRRVREVIESWVDTISLASQGGTRLMKLATSIALDEHDGAIPTCFHVDEDHLKFAMRLMANTTPKQGSDDMQHFLVRVVNEHSRVFRGFRVTMPNGSNSLKNEADDMIKNMLTSMQRHGPSRVASLLSSVARLLGVQKRHFVRPCVRFVLDRAQTLPDLIPPEMVELSRRFRQLFAEKGLHDNMGFEVHRLKGNRRVARVRNILEAFYAINMEHEAIADQARVAGWVVSSAAEVEEDADVCDDEDLVRLAEEVGGLDEEDLSGTPRRKVWSLRTFAMLPTAHVRRRHVRIDNETFTKVIFKKCFDLDVEGLESDSFLSLFKSDRVNGASTLQMRSTRSGWVIGKSFVTDGTSISVPMFRTDTPKGLTASKKQATGLAVSMLSDDTVVVGVDPGNKVLMTCAHQDGSGTYSFSELTSTAFYADAGLDSTRESRQRRVARHAKAANASIALTRQKTHRPADLVTNLDVMSQHSDGLRRAYMSRSACRERFDNHGGRLRVIDGFFNSLPRSATSDGKTVLGFGDADFSPSYKGRPSAPTVQLKRRIDTAFKDIFLRVPVPEHNTTKLCCECHQELHIAHRKITGRDGKTRWVEDHDVRVCASKRCLGSHPCPAHGEMLDGLRAQDLALGQPVHRDRNSSVSMERLARLQCTGQERPACFT